MPGIPPLGHTPLPHYCLQNFDVSKETLLRPKTSLKSQIMKYSYLMGQIQLTLWSSEVWRGQGCLLLLHQQLKVPTILAAQLMTIKGSRRDGTGGSTCPQARGSSRTAWSKRTCSKTGSKAIEKHCL